VIATPDDSRIAGTPAATGTSAPAGTPAGPRAGSVTEALRRSWWIILLLVAVGVVSAAVFTLLAADTYSATASVYVGQTTDANGNVISGLTSNVRAAGQLLDSDALLSEVAEQIGRGMTAARLRSQTTLDTPSQTVRTSSSIVNFVVITVTETDRQLAADAANGLADELLSRISPTSAKRAALLEDQEAQLQAALDSSRARSRQAEDALDALPGAGADAAVVAAPYLAIVQAAAMEQQELLAALQKVQLMLQVAETTEQPRLIHEAAVPDATAQNALALNVAAGALAGLVIGIVVAFVRARPRSAGG
jgi:capsular polysaccharide biosynthesis protein